MMRMKKSRWLLIGIAAVLVLVVGVCWWYVADYYRADEAAVAAMSSAADVTVKRDGNKVAFIPEEADTGFIFYPGGKVEHTAYAPLMHALADQGVLCVLVEMPLNLAILDMNAADGIPDMHTQIGSWYIGGHSLGGSMAASHAGKHASRYDGLVLLASYSVEDISASGLNVISVYGSEDGVLNMEQYAKSKVNLPSSLEEIVIEGGCHAGFGSYGVQAGDGTPTITGDAQVEETVRLLMDFFAGSKE